MSEKLEEDTLDFVNAIEAACVNFKRRVGERHGVGAKEYSDKDFDGLFWETKTGTKGEYQQTNKKANNNHPVFQALQAILKEKDGFCILGGYKFWTHQGDVNLIDRRKK